MEKVMLFYRENSLFVLAGIVFFLLVFVWILVVRKRKKKRRERRREGRRRKEEDVEKTIPLEKRKLEVANLQHQGMREYQEDAFGMTNVQDEEKGVLAILADGMGGMAGGKEASNTAVTAAIEGFQSLEEIRNPAEMLVELANRVNERVSHIPELLHNDGGTTLILCYIKDYDLYYLSVGDSRICLIRNGEVIKLNKEHVLGVSLDEMVKRGELAYEEAMSNPMRKMLTSFIGAEEIPKIDYGKNPIPIQPNDIILLMSDGVFGTLSDQEIVEILRESDLTMSARVMEHRILAKKKKHQDNFTAIIIQKN